MKTYLSQAIFVVTISLMKAASIVSVVRDSKGLEIKEQTKSGKQEGAGWG